MTPGDHPDVLVAMNPALRAELKLVEKGGTIIVNEDAFTQRNLEKAGYTANPLQDGSLDGYRLYLVPMTSITVRAVEELGLTRKEAERSKNMFALGLVLVDVRAAGRGHPELAAGEIRRQAAALRRERRGVQGRLQLRRDDGAVRDALRGEAGACRARRVPEHLRRGGARVGARRGRRAEWARSSSASSIRRRRTCTTPRLKNFGVITLQAEDEIAAAGIALGASFARSLGVTGTSGPGMDLKTETVGLARWCSNAW